MISNAVPLLPMSCFGPKTFAVKFAVKLPSRRKASEIIDREFVTCSFKIRKNSRILPNFTNSLKFLKNR